MIIDEVWWSRVKPSRQDQDGNAVNILAMSSDLLNVGSFQKIIFMSDEKWCIDASQKSINEVEVSESSTTNQFFIDWWMVVGDWWLEIGVYFIQRMAKVG